MPSMFDTYVINEGNKEAYNAIFNIIQQHDTPQNFFIYGPKGSGKTSFMYTRAVEKDLLSTKRCKIHAAAEMIAVLNLDAADFYFEEIGGVDVLLVDDFEGFVNEAQIGPMFCRLMLQERARLGRDTIITSEKPLNAFDLSEFGEEIKSFSEIQIDPLEKSDYVELAIKLAHYYTKDSKNLVLSQDAAEFIASQFVDGIDDVYNSVRFLVQAAGLDDGVVITAEMAKKLLN